MRIELLKLRVRITGLGQKPSVATANAAKPSMEFQRPKQVASTVAEVLPAERADEHSEKKYPVRINPSLVAQEVYGIMMEEVMIGRLRGQD